MVNQHSGGLKTSWHRWINTTKPPMLWLLLLYLFLLLYRNSNWKKKRRKERYAVSENGRCATDIDTQTERAIGQTSAYEPGDEINCIATAIIIPGKVE